MAAMLDVLAAMLDISEFMLYVCRRLTEEHEALVVPSGNRVHLLVLNSFEAVQISQASPAWQDFIDYIDAIVLDGLKQASLTSLKTMLNNLVQANMAEVCCVWNADIDFFVCFNIMLFNAD